MWACARQEEVETTGPLGTMRNYGLWSPIINTEYGAYIKLKPLWHCILYVYIKSDLLKIRDTLLCFRFFGLPFSIGCMTCLFWKENQWMCSGQGPWRHKKVLILDLNPPPTHSSQWLRKVFEYLLEHRGINLKVILDTCYVNVNVPVIFLKKKKKKNLSTIEFLYCFCIGQVFTC